MVIEQIINCQLQVILVPTLKAKARSMLMVRLVLSPNRLVLARSDLMVRLVISPSRLVLSPSVPHHRRITLLRSRLLASRLQRNLSLNLPRTLQPRRYLLRGCLMASRQQRD